MGFSKPELENQAKRVTTQILTALTEAGVKAELNVNSGGIKIPEYFYDILLVIEKSTGCGISRRWSGTLEVEFRSISFGCGTICHAKKFKVETKGLIKKVVASVVERQATLVRHKDRERTEEKAKRVFGKALTQLRESFPEFNGNIGYHQTQVHSQPYQISLNFHDLNEEEARRILTALRNAGISGSES